MPKSWIYSHIVNYDALVFTNCANIDKTQIDQIHDTLYKAVYHYGIGLITTDNWLTNDETGAAVPGDTYRYMKQLMGIGREDGGGPADIAIEAADISHPVMQFYTANESIIDYAANWYGHYEALPGQPVVTLANQTLTGSNPGTYPAVLATETGGRNLHYSTVGLMADPNTLWRGILWSVHGDDKPVGLKIGRQKGLPGPRRR